MATPVKRAAARPLRVTALGTAVAIPWCCLVPAALGSLGIASSLVAQVLGRAIPYLLVLSVVFFSRAHYLLWVEKHGSVTARLSTILLTALAAALWAHRLIPR
jgi:hypothetical protein